MGPERVVTGRLVKDRPGLTGAPAAGESWRRPGTGWLSGGPADKWTGREPGLTEADCVACAGTRRGCAQSGLQLRGADAPTAADTAKCLRGRV